MQGMCSEILVGVTRNRGLSFFGGGFRTSLAHRFGSLAVWRALAFKQSAKSLILCRAKLIAPSPPYPIVLPTCFFFGAYPKARLNYTI